MNISSTAILVPRRVTPNSAACFTALIVSVPALARPITLARLCCAWRRKEEKSVLCNGWRTEPSTLPPASFTKFVVFLSRSWPKA